MNRDLGYNTGNFTQYFVITYMSKSLKEINICVCITESLYYTPETNTTL